MLKQVQICDGCGADLGERSIETDFSVSFWSDRVMSPAGDSENEHESGHLCFNCLRSLITRLTGRGVFVSISSNEISTKLAEFFRELKARRVR